MESWQWSNDRFCWVQREIEQSRAVVSDVTDGSLALAASPKSGGPPRDNFILRPEELDWSEQDFLGGLWAATVGVTGVLREMSE